MSNNSRQSWNDLVQMALDKKNPVKTWLHTARDETFHYVRLESLMEGYKDWMKELVLGGKNQGQEGAYISRGESVKDSRYYFADAAVEGLLARELQRFPNKEKSLESLMERNVLAISGFINGFIRMRGVEIHRSKYPVLSSKG